MIPTNLDTELSRYGIELIAPHRINRKNKTQDLRRLRRYRRRWKIERLFAWLQNFRRLVVRYERYAENFLGMLYLGCCLISTEAYMRLLVVTPWCLTPADFISQLTRRLCFGLKGKGIV